MLRTTRRTALALLGAVLATTMAAAPPSATAAISCADTDPRSTVVCDPTVVSVRHVGWVHLTHCRPNVCTMDVGVFTAWRWTGSTWRHVELIGDQNVYVYPYAGQWRWVWTRQTGWVAMSGERFIRINR